MGAKSEQVVIVCGGEGTRLREETEFKPKALVEIGGRPILWHLMRTYAHYGYRRFILCLGYKGEMIKDYFINYRWRDQDVTVDLKTGTCTPRNAADEAEDWEVTLVETGSAANTGARLIRVQRYVEGDTFLFNYCDALSNVDLDAVMAFHRDKNKIATLTGFHPRSRYGVIQRDDDDIVSYWQEKPLTKDLTSGGYFVMNKRIFDYLEDDDGCILERGPLEKLSAEKQMALYVHHDFWFAMDTYKEALVLNDLWASGKAPWKVWS